MLDGVVFVGVIELVLLLLVVITAVVIISRATARQREQKLNQYFDSFAQGLGGPAVIVRANMIVYKNRPAADSELLEQYELHARESASNPSGGENTSLTLNVTIGNRKFDVRSISLSRESRLIYFEEIEPFRTVLFDSMKRLLHKVKNPNEHIIWRSDSLIEEMEKRSNELTIANDWLNSVQVLRERARDVDTLVHGVQKLADVRDPELLERTRQTFTSLNIHELIQECCKRAEFNISINAPPRLPTVMGNKLFLRQAVDNLINNAIKYSPPDDIDITVKLGHSKTQGRIICKVTDKGRGILEEDLEKIFVDGYRSQETKTVQGHGLGLAYTKAIIENMHGGAIKANNNEGSGSTFTFHLPCAE